VAEFSEETTMMPGGGISKRPLHVIVAADCSGSMMGEKIQSLNYAIAVMIPQLAAWDQEQENASVFLRVVTFGDDVRWHIAEPTPVAEIRWVPLEIVEGAVTNMGGALRAMASVLGPDRLERRALRPVLLLVTDGMPTDDFDGGLAELMATPGGRAALRLAVAIGHDAAHEPLTRFIADPSMPVLVADNAEDIPDLLVAVSIAVSRMSEVRADRDAVAENLLRSSEHPSIQPTDSDIV
jgi:uncharacterized protein YegL